jgi:hypothetical protein
VTVILRAAIMAKHLRMGHMGDLGSVRCPLFQMAVSLFYLTDKDPEGYTDLEWI